MEQNLEPKGKFIQLRGVSEDVTDRMNAFEEAGYIIDVLHAEFECSGLNLNLLLRVTPIHEGWYGGFWYGG